MHLSARIVCTCAMPSPEPTRHLERVTNFLRDHVWGGEQIVGFVKHEFFADAFIETSGAGAVSALEPAAASAGLPAAQIGERV